MGPALICGFVHSKERLNDQTYKSVWRPRPHLWICAHITACLARQYQVYMGSSLHLWFLHAKQKL